TVPEIGTDKRLQPGVLVKARGNLRRDVGGEIIGKTALPGYLENVAGALTGKPVESQTAGGLVGIGVLIDELAEVREEFGPAYPVKESLGDAFRCEVRVPNHGGGIKRIRHLAQRDIHPVLRSPADVSLAEIEREVGFAVGAVIRQPA